MSNEFIEIMRQYESNRKAVFDISIFDKKVKTFKHKIYGDITSNHQKLSLTMNLDRPFFKLILRLRSSKIDAEQPLLEYESIFQYQPVHKYEFKSMLRLLVDGMSEQRATDILRDLDDYDILLREQKELTFDNHDCGICYRETRTTMEDCCGACVCLICLSQVRGLRCPFCRFEFEDVFEVTTDTVDTVDEDEE